MKALIKKTHPCKLLIPAITCLLIIYGCSKSSNPPSNTPDQATLNLLVGSPGKVWQLHDGNYQVWSYGFVFNTGWVEQTLNPGTYLFSNCVVNNNFMVFYADGTSMRASYLCDKNNTTAGVFSNDSGGSGTWSLDADNVTLTGSFSKYLYVKLVSVTATDLYLGTEDGTFHFVSVNAMPFLNTVQLVSGTGSKVWKYNTSAIGANRVIQSLTAAQAATRFTFNADGTLIKSYTDVTYGQPITGTWIANHSAGNGYYTYTFPAVGSSAAINQYTSLWELTNTSFIYQYPDAQNNVITISLIPQ